mmetsp:Transcript_6365/g.23530  ORF Transcript_6365/g.23530 Transcript_6365/m.23530 type:complete len:336 (+) Transcript_6365:157-1164(+)
MAATIMSHTATAATQRKYALSTTQQMARGPCLPGRRMAALHPRACPAPVARRTVQVMSMAEPKEEVKEVKETDENILAYCSLDQRERSLGEKEVEFLEAMRSFYFDGKPAMSNAEFDNLKEELIWEGSNVVVLSPLEQRFLEASMSYRDGSPVLTDEEYDALKMELKEQGSPVAIFGPRCSLRTRRVFSDASPDYLRLFLLNTPAALLAVAGLFLLDDLTGFRITYELELPEPYGFLFAWGLYIPFCFGIANLLTSKLLGPNAVILKGQCPECGAEISSFFGDILTVKGNKEENNVQCQSCKSSLVVNRARREISLVPNDKGAGAKTKKPAKAAA